MFEDGKYGFPSHDMKRLEKDRMLMPTIFIEEDNKKTASLVALYLEREGFQKVVAHDGQQALEPDGCRRKREGRLFPHCGRLLQVH